MCIAVCFLFINIFYTFYKFNQFDTIGFPKGDINSVENVFYDAKTK